MCFFLITVIYDLPRSAGIFCFSDSGSLRKSTLPPMKSAFPSILSRLSSHFAEVSLLKYAPPPILLSFLSPSAEVSSLNSAMLPILSSLSSHSAEVSPLKYALPPIRSSFSSPPADVSHLKFAVPPIFWSNKYEVVGDLSTSVHATSVILFLIVASILVR